MNELERIAREAAALRTRGEAYLLATVVRVSGSSYRRPGARMLVAGERWLAGCVSGGCLEGDVLLRGSHRCKDGPVVVTYDSASEDGEAYRVGLGCDGIVDVLLEHVAAGADHEALAFARACFEAERPGTLVTAIDGRLAVGTRVALGPGAADATGILAELGRGPTGVVERDGVTALVEKIAPSPQLFILGSGHDAAPLARLADAIGFRVTVADRAIREPSRFVGIARTMSGDVAALIDAAAEAYVIVMHHQRDADRDGLRMALASRARYIGVLGPARRTRELLGEHPDDPRLHAPVGLDLGAETPEQIALAIAGELQAVGHRARGGSLRDRTRALHADVATIVLAAGGSRRLGAPKQLLEAGGVPLVRRVAATCVDAGLGPVGVVLGAHADGIAAALEGLPIARIANAAWEDGIASSIRAGVAWAEATGASALLVVLGDQPMLDGSHLGALRAAWLDGAPIAASRFDDIRGAPAIFDRARWPALAALTGDRGAGALVRDAHAIDWSPGAIDIDTPDDAKALALRGFPRLTEA